MTEQFYFQQKEDLTRSGNSGCHPTLATTLNYHEYQVTHHHHHQDHHQANGDENDDDSGKGTPPVKKNVFFRALPEKGGGGPCPNFLDLFFTMY